MKNNFIYLLLTVFALLGYQAKAQQCYAPITGNGVTVSSFGGDGILCSSILCLGDVNYRHLQNIIDDNDTTATNFSAFYANLQLQGIAVRNYNTVYPAGYVAGFKFTSSRLFDISLGRAIIVETFLNGVYRESIAAGDLPSISLFAQNEEEVYMTFPTTKSFNEVRIKFIGLDATFLRSIKIYNAVAFDPAACTTVTTNTCGRPISGIGTAVSFDGANTCIGCNLSNKDNINSTNANSYADLRITGSIISSPTVSVLNKRQVYPAGYNAGFVVSESNASSFAFISALGFVTIETYLFGKKQEVQWFKNGQSTGLISARVLNFFADNQVKIGFKTTKPFNEVRFKYNQLANVSVGTSRIYYAFAEPADCQDCNIYLGSQSTGKYSGSLVSNTLFTKYNGTYGLALHSLLNQNNVVTANPNDYAYYTGSFIGGFLSGAKMTVKNNGTLFPGGTSTGFEIENTGTLFSVDLLNYITITTYKVTGSSIVEVERNVRGVQLLGGDILGGASEKAKIGFKTTKPFNAVQINLGNGLLDFNGGLGGNTKIYGAYVFEDADGDGYGDCIDVCLNGDDAIDTDGDGVPDACDVCQVTNLYPELTARTITNNCANQENFAVLPTAIKMPSNRNISLQFHTVPSNPTSATRINGNSVTTSGTVYGYFYDAEHACYSLSTPVAVNIGRCEQPNLTVKSLFGQDLLPAKKLGWGIQVANVTSAVTTAPIVVRVKSDANNINASDVTFDSTSNELSIAGAVFRLTNPNYTVSVNARTQELVFTSKADHRLLGNESEVIGLEIVKGSRNTAFMSAIFHINVSGGGDAIEDINNQATQLFNFDFNANYDLTKLDALEGIEIYPNPATDYVFVNGTKEGDIIKVLDVTGKTIHSEVATKSNVINTARYAPGSYVIQIISDTKVSNAKLIKQ